MSEGDAPRVRLRFDVAYDGTDFHGWAKQPGLRTVQGEIETALHQLVRTEHPPQLTVGGRTDAGVHARGQVAHIDLDEGALQNWLRNEYQADALDTALMARRLNGVLHRTAEDAQVHTIRVVPTGFDARFSALWRRYEYRIADAPTAHDPLTRRFTAEIDTLLDLDLLNRASERLLGLRDFTTFCKAREGSTAIRTLQQFVWERDSAGVLVCTIQADAFCHSMVRALVGAVTAVASGKFDLDELVRLADAKERTPRFAVMPAHGLSLEEIGYPSDDELATRADQTRARREALVASDGE